MRHSVNFVCVASTSTWGTTYEFQARIPLTQCHMSRAKLPG
jgi:hypothetical protein